MATVLLPAQAVDRQEHASVGLCSMELMAESLEPGPGPFRTVFGRRISDTPGEKWGMNRTRAVVKAAAAAAAPSSAAITAVVPVSARPGDRLLVSVGEALWRTGWDLDRAGFMARLEADYPDALVMTGKGVRVDLIQLLSASPARVTVTLPPVSVLGPVEFDTLR